MPNPHSFGKSKGGINMKKKMTIPSEDDVCLLLIGRGEAISQGICIKCKKAIDKNSMDNSHRKIYEESGLCTECFEDISKKVKDEKAKE